MNILIIVYCLVSKLLVTDLIEKCGKSLILSIVIHTESINRDYKFNQLHLIRLYI